MDRSPRSARWFTLLLTLVVVFSMLLSACGGPTPAPTAPPTKAPEPTKAPAAPTAAPTIAPTKAPAAPTTAAPAPTVASSAGKYSESPLLTDLVKAGKLPPVEQRLPENPLVVPVVDEIGQYGGVWRRGFLGPSDANHYVRITYDALVRFSPDGSKVEPKVAELVTPSADFSTWTVKLRKGSKWSDGTAFNADAIMFWYNDVLLNKDLTPSIPSWMKNKDGSTAKVEKVDDVTVRWVFAGPNTFFLNELANKDGGDRTFAVFLPAHYLKQFHATYAKAADLDKMVADAKFKTWPELFAAKNAPVENPDRPTMGAWVPTSRVSDPVLTLKRNPYYVGVDPKGNQLPYIDEVRFTFFADKQALNLAAIAGDIDMQERHIDLGNFPVLKENAQKGKYQVITWPTFGGSDATVVFNQTYQKDAEIGKLLATKDFRIALSYAINRDQIIQGPFLGVGDARQAVPAPWHPYYPGDEYANKYTQYNTAEANKLLDAIGLNKKDSEGFRLLPSGKRAIVELSVVPSAFGPWPDVAQLITRDWEKVGVKVNLQLRERTLHFSMRESNDLQIEMWNNDTTAFPFTGQPQTDIRSKPAITVGPLYRVWYETNGKEGLEPTAEIKKLVELTDKAKTVGPEEQAKIAQEVFKMWVDQEYQVGTVGLTPMIQGVVLYANNFKNVPKTLGNDWPLRTPGNGRTEQFFFKK